MSKDYAVFVNLETNIVFIEPPKDHMEEMRRNNFRMKMQLEIRKQLNPILEDLAETLIEEYLLGGK